MQEIMDSFLTVSNQQPKTNPVNLPESQNQMPPLHFSPRTPPSYRKKENILVKTDEQLKKRAHLSNNLVNVSYMNVTHRAMFLEKKDEEVI